MTDIVINWKSFDILLNAPSKKSIKKLLWDCFNLRNKVGSFEEKYKTPIIEGLCQDFNIDETTAHSAIVEIVNLINACAAKNFDDIEGLFPGDFHDQMRKLLIETIKKEYAPVWRSHIMGDLVQGSKLIDFDWRIDVQLGTDTMDKIQNTIVYVNIDSLNKDTNEMKSTPLQLNKQELFNLYENFKKIKDQINLIVSEQQSCNKGKVKGKGEEEEEGYGDGNDGGNRDSSGDHSSSSDGGIYCQDEISNTTQHMTHTAQGDDNSGNRDCGNSQSRDDSNTQSHDSKILFILAMMIKYKA